MYKNLKLKYLVIVMSNTDVPMIFVEKGWGHELWVDNNEEFCGKRLFMTGGKKLSWHYHLLKRETFFVQSGSVKLLYGDTDDITQAKEKILHAGENFHVPRGLRHRLIALEDSYIFEFSTQHFDSDSIRVEAGDLLTTKH